MSVISEKLKFLIQSELNTDYELVGFDLDYESNSMMVTFLVNIMITDQPYLEEITNYLHKFNDVMIKTLKNYKFEPNGRITKPISEITVEGMINSITFDVDEKFQIEGLYQVSW